MMVIVVVVVDIVVVVVGGAVMMTVSVSAPVGRPSLPSSPRVISRAHHAEGTNVGGIVVDEYPSAVGIGGCGGIPTATRNDPSVVVVVVIHDAITIGIGNGIGVCSSVVVVVDGGYQPFESHGRRSSSRSIIRIDGGGCGGGIIILGVLTALATVFIAAAAGIAIVTIVPPR